MADAEDLLKACLKNIKAAEESKDFHKDHRGQVELVCKTAELYSEVDDIRRQMLKAKSMHLIPRITESENQGEMFDKLMDLASPKKPWGMPDVSRALKVRKTDSDNFIISPEEDIYPKSGWIGRFMEWCKISEVPLGYNFWAAISIIGASCRYNYFIDRGAYFLRLNHYIIMVGKKGLGKSQGVDAVKEIVQRINSLIEPDMSVATPYRVNLLPEDTNVETLTKRMGWKTLLRDKDDGTKENVGVDSTGLIALDELTTFLSKDNWAIGKRIPWLTTLYSRSYYEYETSKHGFVPLKNLALSLLAATATDWMSEAITPLLFSGGFMDRTRYIYREVQSMEVKDVGRRKYPTPPPMDPLVGIDLAQDLVRLTKRDGPIEMLPDPACEEWYNWWYHQQPDEMPESGTSLHRFANHAWKLAAVLSISCGDEPWIRAPYLQGAVDYLNDEEKHFHKFQQELFKAPEDDQLKYIMKMLKRWGGEAMQSKLYNTLRQRKGLSPPNIKAPPYLDALRKMNLLEQIPKGRGTLYKVTKEGWDE